MSDQTEGRLPFEPWPCRTVPAEHAPPRLVAFLYRILRDYVQPGDIEQVCLDMRPYVGDATSISYSNPHLEALARAHAAYLTETTESPEVRSA